MEQISVVSYDVTSGENVTLTVTAVKVSDPVAVALDGSTVTPDPGTKWVYRFPITKTSGSQTLDVQCSFDATAPVGAQYTFTLEGDRGGGSFDAGEVDLGDPTLSIEYAFSLP